MHDTKIIFLWTKDFWFQNFSAEIISANSFAHQLITNSWFTTPDNIYAVESVLQINYEQEVNIAS